MRKKRFLLRQSALVLIRVQAASLFPPGSALPKVASSPVLPEGGHAGQGAPAPILGSPGPKRAVLSMGCAGSSHCFCATNIGRPFFPDSFVSNIPCSHPAPLCTDQAPGGKQRFLQSVCPCGRLHSRRESLLHPLLSPILACSSHPRSSCAWGVGRAYFSYIVPICFLQQIVGAK